MVSACREYLFAGGIATIYPPVHFLCLEFPQLTNLVGGHSLVFNPSINSLWVDPQVCCDLFYREPSCVIHLCLSYQLNTDNQDQTNYDKTGHIATKAVSRG